MSTTTQPVRESFIPCCRRDLIDLCLEEGQLSADQTQAFTRFCKLISAYYHFRFQAMRESLKENYAPFNPNADIATRFIPAPQEQQAMATEVVQTFQQLLKKANYHLLPHDALQEALQEASLIDLKTEVDFNEFKQLICYYRGDVHQTITTKKFWHKKEQVIDVLERVVLLIQFQKDAFFEQQGIDPLSLDFVPGQIYLYFYKNVPKSDLELLFPNVRTRMTLKDRLLLIVPAIGAGIAVLLKVLPQSLLVIGVLLFILDIPVAIDALQVSKEETEKVLPLLISVLSLAIALGGFAFKQYDKYKSKRIAFQKKVTDTLFFRNIANNNAVFQLLVDVAEEEECNEVILAYYHLLISPRKVTVTELDKRIETWLFHHLGIEVDFDVPDAVEKMRSLQIQTDDGVLSLLTINDDRYCEVLELVDAQQLLSTLWDQAFTSEKITV